MIVDDHPAVGRGIELLLRSAGVRVTGVATRTGEAIRTIVDRVPDVAIVDLRLGQEDGLDVIRAVAAKRPGVALLGYTGFADRARVEAAFAVGAKGCALKARPATELLAAVRALAAGDEYVDPALTVGGDARSASRHVITAREREVIEMVAGGLTATQIADVLVLSTTTVDTHVRNAIRKLGAHNRTHAVTLAACQGEIELSSSSWRR